MQPATPDRSRRLGRGLGALLGPHVHAPADQSPEIAKDEGPLREVPLDLVQPNPLQPRREFSEGDLSELRESIRASGLLQPVTVRQRSDGHFELIAGERRLRAVRQLGWSAIPAYVRSATNEQMLSLALVENLQRADLNPIEEAEGYRQLAAEFGLSHQDIAQAVGKERSSVTNALRLLTLPEDIQQMVRNGTVSHGHAKALAALPDEEAIRSAARRILEDRLTVRDVERLTQESKSTSRRVRARTETGSAGSSAEISRIEDRLRRFLQTDVSVQADEQARGEVRIRFYSAEDLERLLDLMLGATRSPD